MKNSVLLAVPLLCCVFVAPAVPQAARGHMPTPPPPMDKPDPTSGDQQTLNASRHIDLLKLQQEADELARTAQTIPVDVSSVRQGKLPKDVIQKLKQIEKLSKHLRGQLAP